MPRILVIEDDSTTAGEIIEALSAHGFETEWKGDGKEGLASGIEGGFDAITLDRLLPTFEGLEILTRLRSKGIKTPVLVLSALGDIDERIRGLRAGGDDYLTKPFSLAELTARIDALLRRQQMNTPISVLRVADLEMDLLAREVRRGGRKIELVPREFKLLEFLMRHAGEVVTRRMLFEAVWDYHFEPQTNVIEVQIGRLRRKLDEDAAKPLLKTVKGSGYVLQTS
jgi:two-component system, OmpR family, response regulator